MVVSKLIGVHKPIPTQDEGAQCHEQSIRLAFGAPPGNKPKNPSQIIESGHEQSPARVKTPQATPSCLGSGSYQK
jgi:hypothetical protein